MTTDWTTLCIFRCYLSKNIKILDLKILYIKLLNDIKVRSYVALNKLDCVNILGNPKIKTYKRERESNKEVLLKNLNSYIFTTKFIVSIKFKVMSPDLQETLYNIRWSQHSHTKSKRSHYRFHTIKYKLN